MKKSIINACILGLGLLSMTACSDQMDEITSLIVGRNFSPVNFDTKDITKESASFQWTAVSGATSYELQIFADSDLDFSGEPTFRLRNQCFRKARLHLFPPADPAKLHVQRSLLDVF